MLLTIHNQNLEKVAFVDNRKQGTLNYYNDRWTRRLDSGSSSFEFTVFKKAIETDGAQEKAWQHLNEKAFVSFEHKGKVFLFNVMQVEEDEKTITVLAENLNLELLNEYAGPYTATKAMSFEDYLKIWGMLENSAMVIGVNEVKDQTRKLEWTGQDTNLRRLLSIANNFNAEIEFETVLHPNSQLKNFVLNIYKENDGDKHQGVGKRRDTIIRYGKDIKGITKTTDKTGIWNAVRPSGQKEVTRVIDNPTQVTASSGQKTTATAPTTITYEAGALGYYGNSLSKEMINKILTFSRQFKLLPSGVICQLYLESHWGNSNVGRRDNNWSGMSGSAQTRPSGIVVTTGSNRPPNEGGTYFRYASVDDFLYDYMYLLGPNGNGYKTSGADTFAKYTAGLFRSGGARYDYAESGYQHYLNSMNSIRNGINQANGNRLDEIDNLYKSAGTATTTKSVTTKPVTDSRLEKMVQWFESRRGKVTYSMTYRGGPNSYDCSSSIYYAMLFAGFRDTLGWAFSTELEHDMLVANGFQLVAENKPFTLQRGDVIIWGRRGASAGAAGHTMLATSSSDIIHCNFGANGISVNNYASYAAGKGYYTYLYRLKGAVTNESASVTTTQAVVQKATKTANALAELEKRKGQRIGSGQCYGLVALYSYLIGGPGLGGGVTAITDLHGDGMSAKNIGHAYNWSKYGWRVKTSGVTANDIQPGVLFNWNGDAGNPYGHTGVVKSVSGTTVVTYEQNVDGRQYCLTINRSMGEMLRLLTSICIPPELVAGSTVAGKTVTTGSATPAQPVTETYVSTEKTKQEITEVETLYIDAKKTQEWKNDEGVVEFYLKNGVLYAPLSREAYPSVLTGKETKDNWIRKDMTVETDSEEVLISTALRELRRNCYPAVTYEMEGYVDLDIGDTVRIDDDGFVPKLLLEARVSEQEISFTNPANNKTIFSNFKALENQVSQDLLSRMNALFEEARPYSLRRDTDKGVAFKNGEGQSVITPTLTRGGRLVDAGYRWVIDGVIQSTAPSFTVKASDVEDVLVVTVAAWVGDREVASQQLTFTHTVDGRDGVAGSKGDKGDKGDTGARGPQGLKGDKGDKGDRGDRGPQGLQGADGRDGIPGAKGADGRTQYTHIAYADTISGSGFSQTDTSKNFIGMYQDFTQRDSTNPQDYRWSRWHGKDGTDGVPGPKGSDGRTPYIHFAYAESPDGRTGFSLTQTGNKRYLGTYTDFERADSTDPTKYRWVDMVGTVEVGGRNYALKTANAISHAGNGFLYDLSDVAKTFSTKTNLTLSFDWEVTRPSSTGKFRLNRVVEFSDGTSRQWNNVINRGSIGSDDVLAKTLRGHYSQPMIWVPLTSQQVSRIYLHLNQEAPSGTVRIKNLKLELGNIATDWSPAPEDVESELASKADQVLTQEQLNALNEQAMALKADLEARATMAEVAAFIQEYQAFVKANEEGRKASEAALATAGARLVAVQQNLGELKTRTDFVDNYISQSEEGLIIGRKDGSASLKIDQGRISMFSAGNEVMYISQGVIHIDNGIFTKTLQIGRFRTEEYGANPDVNVIRYIWNLGG